MAKMIMKWWWNDGRKWLWNDGENGDGGENDGEIMAKMIMKWWWNDGEWWQNDGENGSEW